MTPSLSSDIIVGIDFGTTYSGVSWAINEGKKNIRLITDWPNPAATNANAEKVPTVISYKNGRVANWGYDVGLEEEAFHWIKILLEPNSKDSSKTQQAQNSSNLLRKINKTVEEVIGDYLEQIWKYTKEAIRKHLGDNNWEVNFKLHVVLTVPAMWSHAAKEKTLEAAKKAGLPQDIKLVTEPEAAALETLHDRNDERSLKKGDVFVVCDAGGGTVDLISYKVNNVSPLEIEECAIGDGGLCGSTYMDEYFEKYVKTLVGEAQYGEIRDIDKRKMMRVFEHGVKRCVTPELNKNYTVDLHGVKDNRDVGICYGTIELDRTMLRTMFDQVCDQIKTLVQTQIEEVIDRDLKVKSILLVGGFGSSKYLHHELEKTYLPGKISVLQIDGGWSAICRGACRWGLEYVNRLPGAPTALAPTVGGRISRYNYGVVVRVPVDPKKPPEAGKRLNESANRHHAKDQMEWLLRKGEKIPEGTPLSTRVIEGVYGVDWMSFGRREFGVSLYYCQDKQPPPRKEDNVKKLCSISYSVSKFKIWLEPSHRSVAWLGKRRDMSWDLKVSFGSVMLDYEVEYKGKVIGSVKAKYE